MAQPAFSTAAYALSNANLLDLFGVMNLERVCFGTADAYGLDTLFTLLLTPNTVRIKAVANGKVVGFVAGEFEKAQRAGWIITIGVLPTFTGRGIGSDLLDAAEHKLFQAATRVKLTVRRSNDRAIKLYQRSGYRWVNTYQHYYRDGEDGLVMEKTV